MLVKGSALNGKQIAMVLSAFVYRNTHENRKARPALFATGPMASCSLFMSDREWVESHAFHFVKDGSRLMSNRQHAEPHYACDVI